MDQLTNGFSVKEIEQAAISALVQWPDKCFSVIEQYKITSEHFKAPFNRALFDCVNNFYKKGRPLDLILITSDLRDLGLLESVGGVPYLTETWYRCCYSPLVMEYYCGIIEESFARRALVDTCYRFAKEAKAPGANAGELVPESVKKLSEIPINSAHRKERTLMEAVEEKLERMEKGEPAEDVIETGLAELDRLSPLRRGDMPIIAGERKAGKTLLALSIALNVARKGLPVLYFSLEDREQKITDRLFAAVSRIPFAEHHVKSMGKDLMDRSIKASTELRALSIYVKDKTYDLTSIIAVSHELKTRAGVGLIVVDYAQLVRVKEGKDSNREQKVAEVSRGLRLLAMELDTPIIVLSQLNKEGATRESRALEQDCTAMWQIEFPDEEEESANVRSIVIPFQRNGPSGKGFKVTFLGEIGRVENYEHEAKS